MQSEFDELAADLELTPRECVALQLLMESMHAAAQRRMPHGIQLFGVGIDIGRVCTCDDDRDGLAGRRRPGELN